MRNDIKQQGFHISTDAVSFGDDFLESVFFTGNGRMGVRGYSPYENVRRPIQTGLFVAGVFGEIKPGITDFINLPTPVFETIFLEGIAAQIASAIHYDLDLSCGLLQIHYRVKAADKEAEVLQERFFPITKPALLLQRTKIIPLQNVSLHIDSGLYTDSCNNPIPDDQVKENSEQLSLVNCVGISEKESGFSCCFSTVGTDITLHQSIAFHTQTCNTTADIMHSSAAITKNFTVSAIEGQEYVLDKAAAITSSRDKDSLIAPMPNVWDYADLLHENKAAWKKIWDIADIQITGDDTAQNAIRYCIYELIVNCSARDDSVSIGARGLTHTRYKGCYFWDTDFFMMPFFLFTNPTAAKSLMQYRVNTLPAAKKHSRKMGTAGARYAWMASMDASEQCESWDIGASEVHVTADIVYALQQYIETSGDIAFYENNAAEVYIETARFWKSRYTFDAKTGIANLLFCKGPDEYCGITSNNLFTNALVKYNLELAIKTARMLRNQHAEKYRQLGITDEEMSAWNTLKEQIPLPKDAETGHYRTDDTFHLLEPVNITSIKSDDSASYHNICFDRLQRYKVIKQADVLLLMTRRKNSFTAAERIAAWNDFEPLCLHDSTLSFASHALFAAQNGLYADAEKYLEKALYLDLKDIMGNTGKEGLHLACFGEVWQAILFGFAGLSLSENGPCAMPHLPSTWKKLSTQFYAKGKRYQLTISNNNAEIRLFE
ncbi:MAG: glycoside hydrolase family 65 protein [Oscillospiraceae bacterium]